MEWKNLGGGFLFLINFWFLFWGDPPELFSIQISISRKYPLFGYFYWLRSYPKVIHWKSTKIGIFLGARPKNLEFSLKVHHCFLNLQQFLTIPKNTSLKWFCQAILSNYTYFVQHNRCICKAPYISSIVRNCLAIWMPELIHWEDKVI